ncbi:MAG: S41 family peptidase [Firmicutes bacterium]|nr:S41 family peptidase [Bacillota bacterium]
MEKIKQSPFLWLAPIILALMGIGVVPLLNLFLLPMPEWITVIISAAILTAAVIMWLRLKRKLPAKIIISVFSVWGICISLFSSYCNPYWNSITFKSGGSLYYCKDYDCELTYEQAKADLDYAYKYLKKLHPAFYKEIPAEVKERYDSADANLKSAEKITVNLLASEIQGMFFLLGDAHTNLSLNYPEERYMKYIYSHNKAGDTLVGINGQSLESLLKKGSPCYGKVSYEVSSWGVIRLKKYLSTLEGLDYLGIPADKGITYNYESESGEKTDRFAEESDFLSYEEYVKFNGIADDIAEETSFVSYTVDKDLNAAVLTLDECNYNSEYINTLKSMFAEIKAQGIENLAVDLRENGGGNSLVANEFFRYLDIDSFKEGGSDWRLGCFMLNFPDQVSQNRRYEDLLFEGNVYLLTSNRSFSSAMLFAQFVKDNGLGTVIGEAPGNNPNGYGDISVFRLPNSGAVIQISTKHFYRIDNKEGLIDPDIPCKADQALDSFYSAIKQ